MIPLTEANKYDWGFDWTIGYDDPEYASYCIEYGGSVRSIVQPQAGLSLDRYFGYLIRTISPTTDNVNLFYQYVLQIARSTMNLLERLHATGVVHGDMHWGNVAFTTPDHVGSASLVLLDLGLSATICGSEEALKTTPAYQNILRSPWQFIPMQNRGFRDDVFQNLQMISIFMSLGKLHGVLRAEETMLERKKTYPFFDLALFEVPINADMSKALNEIVDYVREIPTFDTPIDYKFI